MKFFTYLSLIVKFETMINNSLYYLWSIAFSGM